MQATERRASTALRICKTVPETPTPTNQDGVWVAPPVCWLLHQILLFYRRPAGQRVQLITTRRSFHLAAGRASAAATSVRSDSSCFSGANAEVRWTAAGSP